MGSYVWNTLYYKQIGSEVVREEDIEFISKVPCEQRKPFNVYWVMISDNFVGKFS